MPSFYSGSSSYAAPTQSAPISPSFPTGSSSDGSAPEQDSNPGKASIDLGNLLGSIGESAGNVKDFISGTVGQIGIPGGPNLGDVAELPGGLVDAVGQIGFGDGANVGAIPGIAGDLIGATSRFVEGEGAKARLRNAQGTGTPLDNFLANIGGTFNPLLPASPEMTQKMALEAAIKQGHQPTREEIKFLQKWALPEDIQARLDAGESIDTLADEMVKRGVGYSNDPIQNIVSGITFDPLNLLAPGAGKVASIASGADKAIRAGAEIGMAPRAMGLIYGGASRGLSAGGQRLMDAVVGPTTSGVFHALGTRPYQALKSGLAGINPDYAQSFEDAFARGAAQMPRAVIARYMAEEATLAIQRYGRAAIGRLTDDVGGTIEARLSAIRRINPDQIERRTQELLNRVSPDFLGHTDEGRFVETRDKLAAITGMSSEDAARALNGKASLRTAQQVHLAFYGKAGSDLSLAKAASAGSKAIDAERLTLVAPDSLTDEAALEILGGGPEKLESAVEQYSILRNRFGGKQYDHADVLDFVRKLHDEGALVKAVKAPITGKRTLPPALKAWQRQYEKFGYNIGFAPKDGWKTIIDHNSDEVIYADPFVHFVSEADPLTMRNPLGRFMDSLMRGATQTTIIATSRARMVKLTRGKDVTPNEARSIHQRILQRAADEGTTPRGLSLSGPHVYEDIFREVLGDSRYHEFVQKIDPNYVVMKAFEGNLSEVGLSQKFTGKAKTEFAGRGNVAAAIAEGIYPRLRFALSPLFQSQEFVESPFLNAMRGVQARQMDPEIVKVYEELADLPDFKYLTEAGYFLHIAGGAGAKEVAGEQSLIGKALHNVPNIKAFKERQRTAQVFHEHGAAFEQAVNQINPALWRRMTEAYGTTDARIIADRFIGERMALASGDLDEAMAVFDAAKPQLVGHDQETVWQAFRESFRQASVQAFKTHYFNPTRGFLERTINHPYLGFYPASYMWGKVLPEFARFLVRRPFGMNAPLVGLAAYNRVAQTVIGQAAIDPEFDKFLEKNKDVIYLIEQLLPATPSNLPANLPAWQRHFAEDVNAGKKIDPQQFIQREAADTFANAAGPIKSLNVLSGAAGDIYDQLQKAAREYDSQAIH